MCAPYSTIHNGHDMEATSVPINGRLGQGEVVRAHSRILRGREKE